MKLRWGPGDLVATLQRRIGGRWPRMNGSRPPRPETDGSGSTPTGREQKNCRAEAGNARPRPDHGNHGRSRHPRGVAAGAGALRTSVARASRSPRVGGGDGDPAIGDPIQVDQIIGFDLAGITQAVDHLLDQDGIVLGQLDRGRCDSSPVAIDQHGMLTEGCAAAIRGCSRTGSSRPCTMDAQARPDPPSSVGTGRGAFVRVTGNMGFSFAMKGNASPGGELGVPRSGSSARRSGSAARQAARRLKAPHPCGRGPSLGCWLAGRPLSKRSTSAQQGLSMLLVTEVIRPGRTGSTEGR